MGLPNRVGQVTFASLPTLPHGAYPPGTRATTSDAGPVHVNAAGTAWERDGTGVVVGGSVFRPGGFFGHVLALAHEVPQATLDFADDAGLKSLSLFEWSSSVQLSVEAIDVSGSSVEKIYLDGLGPTTLDVRDCDSLLSLVCNLSHPGLTVQISPGSPALRIFSVDYCSGTLDLSGCTNLEEVYVSSGAIPSLDLSGCAALTVLYVDSITGLSTLDLSDSPLLATLQLISLPDLETFTVAGNTGLSTFTMGASGMDALATITFDDCALTTLFLQGMPELATLTLTDMALLASLHLEACPELDTVDVSQCPLLATFNAPDMALTEAGVNAILVALAAGTVEDGTVTISGGTSAAPSGAGLAAKTTLEGRGWTVTVPA